MRQSSSDQVTVVGACVTLIEALKAADELATAGIGVCVVDPFTIKPIDVDTILHCARQTGGRLVVVEDHYPEGDVCLLSRYRLALYSNAFVSKWHSICLCNFLDDRIHIAAVRSSL